MAESWIRDLNFLWNILSDHLCVHLLEMEIVETASRSPGWHLGHSPNIQIDGKQDETGQEPLDPFSSDSKLLQEEALG